MNKKTILLVEDDPNDEALALRAFSRNNLLNEVVVMRDGAEALDYLFGAGKHAERDMSTMPVVIMIDLKLPKIGGLEVLKRLRRRADEIAPHRHPHIVERGARPG